MVAYVEPFHRGGLRTRTIALLVCVVMVSSAIPIFALMTANGTHNAPAIVPAREEENDYARFIQVNNFRFDPLAESPDVPEWLSYRSLDSSAKTYCIVQFNGPITQQMKQDLRSTGMQVLYYINYNAFIVLTDENALERAKALPSFRWSGVFEPAYKLSPRLSDSYEQMLSEAAERNIDGVPGTVYSLFSGNSIDSLSKSFGSSSSRSASDVKSSARTTSSPFRDRSLPSEATSNPTIDVLITTFEKSWVDEVAGVASELGGSEILYSYNSWGMVRTVIDKSALTQLAREPGVMWIDRQTDAYIFNDIARWVIQSADTVDFATPIHEQGIWGTGQTVTVGDTGIDYDHDAFRDPTNGTPGASHRKVTDYYIPVGATGDSTDNDINHGSHVSGTVAGDDGTWHIYDGNPSGSNGTAGPHDGQAFDAKIQVQDLSQDGYSVGTPDDMHDLFQPALDRDSYIHTNSWGNYGNQYITEAYQTDDFLWYNQDFIVCFAAGNYGSSLYSISPFAAAKNVIAVGATENGMYLENVADFSSRGPCADGRVKPDVMAPGSGTWSVRGMDPGSTQNDYWQLSGTSMATPTVAGSVALIRQYYMDGFFPTGTKRLGDGFVPSAALVKATLINSAAEMTGNGAYANGQLEYPNNNQGWGRILLDDALFFQNDSRGASIYDNRAGLETGGSVSYSLAIGDTSMPVEITLVWTDYPGVPLTSPALVNDLNLVVTAPDGTVYRGNVYQGYDPGESKPDPALLESDHLNNVESVLILTNPKAGLWTVTVSGYNVPSGPQPYAIVMSGGLATDKGTVRMDENVYKSSATVIVQAVDLGLNTDPLSIETVTVNMYSSTEALPEVLLLIETGADTAVFAGVIQLQNSAAPIDGDVILQVQNGDNITAEYYDADDGLGGSGLTYDHAYVDDDPPVISGVGVINIRFNRATIVWTTDEASSSVTRYGDSIPPNSSRSDPGFSSSHEMMIRGLNENTTYYFSVESTDEAGNLAIADNGGGYYEFTTTASPIAPISSDEWPTFHNNNARVGASPGVFSPPIDKQWNSSETYYSMFSSPIMSDGMLFATSLDGVISARDAFSGDLIWDARLGDRDMYTGTPTVADGVVYTTFYEEPVNISGGTVYALDELTGDILWSVGPETGIDFNARIAMADGYGLVFGAAWSGEIFAMNATTGAMEWIYQTGDLPFGGIAVDAGQIFIGTVDFPRIISLDASTGSLVWERAVDVQVNSAPLVSGGCLYVGTYGGTLYCLDEWSGDVVWQVGGFEAFFYSTPAFDGSTLYFSTESGKCYAVDAFDGSLLWSVSLSYTSYGSLAYANGFIYVGMFEGYLYVIDALDGTVADTERISDYGISSSPSVSEGWVWIEDYYGAIHAFMGQIPVGLIVRPTSQTKDVTPSSVVDYTIDVTNTGSSGADTFDAFVTPGAQGWATELFKADGMTVLPDTDGDSVPDTGPISKGTSVSVVVRVTVPGSASVDDMELAILSFRSSIDVSVDRQAIITSIVPPPGVDIGPRSYFQVSPGDVRTAWMNVTNTGAFTDTIDITALSLNDWILSILSQDGVTPLPDTDSDGLQDTGTIPPFGHVTVGVRVEVSSAALPGMLEITTVTGTSSLDVDANDTSLVVLELPSPPNIDWPTFHNGNQRQGASPSITTPPLDQVWVSAPYLESDWSGPVLADGILISTTMDGLIRAHDPYTGVLLWSRLLGDDYFYTGTPAVEDGIVYTISYGYGGGYMYALDETTGATIWSFGLERGMDLNARTPVAVSAGLVFGCAWDGEVFAVDADNGAEVWRYESDNYWPSGVAISGGAVYFGTADGYAFALDEFKGELLWSSPLDGMAVSAPMCADGIVYIGTNAGSMYALDSLSGEVVWQRSVGSVWLSTPAYGNSAIFFGATDTYNYSDGYFYALDPRSGSTIWSVRIQAHVESSVAYANGYVFGTATNGLLYTLSASSGSIVDSEQLAYGSTSSPAVSNGWVWVQDSDGHMYAFKGKLPVGVEVEPQLQEMSAVPDSTVAFTVTVRNVGTSGPDAFDATLNQGPMGWPIALFCSDGMTPLPDTDGDGVPDTGPLGYENETNIVVKVSVPAGVVTGDQETSLLTFTSSNDANVSASVTVTTIIPPPGVAIGPGGYRTSSPGSTEYFSTNVTNTGAALDVIDLTFTSTLPWPVALYESDGISPLVDNDWDGVPDTGVLAGLVSHPIVMAVSVPESTPLDSYASVTLRGTSTVDPDETASAKFRLEVPGPDSLEWPTYQHDPARKGSAPEPHDLPLSKMWTYGGRGGSSSYVSPIFAGGAVYYTTTYGYVMAVNGGSGEEIWAAHIGSLWQTTSVPTYSEGKVFVGYADVDTMEPSFSALDAETGAVVWTFQTDDYMDYGTPVTRAGVVYLCTHSGTVYALDADTGEEQWKYAISNSTYSIYAGPSIIDDMLVISNTVGSAGYVTALDLDGNHLWNLTYPSYLYGAPSGGDGRIFIAGYSGCVYAIDSATGTALWSSDTYYAFGLSALAYGDGVVFIADLYGIMHALDADTGGELWYDYMSYQTHSPAILNNGNVFQVSGNGYLSIFDAATGDLIDFVMVSEHPIYSGMALADGVLYIIDSWGMLSAYGFAGWDAVASIESTPESAIVPIGGYTMFDVVAENRYGGVIENQTFIWTVVSGSGSLTLLDDAGESILFAAGMYSGTTVLQVSIGNISTLVQVVVPPGAIHEILVSPSEGWVTVGSTMQFTAMVYDALGNEITGLNLTWTSTIGDIDSSGMLSAGTGSGTGTVTATVGSVSGSATVQVLSGPLDHISATPSSLAVVAGGMSTISVVGEDVYGNEVTGVTYAWSSTLGAVYPLGATSEALFQAGTIVGSGTINVSCGSVSTEIPISVIPGALDGLVITPSSVALTVGETLQFAVSGFDAYGNAVSGLTIEYSVSGDVGSINGTGMLTAGSSTGTGGVIATSGGFTVQASVTIGPGPLDRIAVFSMNSVTVSAGSVVILSATGYDAHGNEIADLTFSWSADNGSITLMAGTSDIVYQAGTSVGSRTVTAANGSAVGSLDLSVVPGPLATLVVDPAAVVADSGDSVDLTVRGYDAYGNLVANLAFTWSISSTSSTIDAIGTLSPHEDTKTATLIAGDGATGTITVSCGDKSAVVSVTVSESPSALTKAVPSLALAAVIAVIVLAVLLVLMLLGKIRMIGKKE